MIKIPKFEIKIPNFVHASKLENLQKFRTVEWKYYPVFEFGTFKKWMESILGKINFWFVHKWVFFSRIQLEQQSSALFFSSF